MSIYKLIIKKFIIILLISFCISASGQADNTILSEYDLATIAILDDLIVKNYAKSKTIKTTMDFKTVWTDTKPKQLLEIYLGGTYPKGIVLIHDLPYLEKIDFNIYSYDDYGIGRSLALHNLPNLKTLIVTKSGLSSIMDIKGLENITSLESLDLSENKLIKIDGLATLTNLISLNLRDNRIEKLNNLDSLIRLKNLDLSQNQIQEIEGLEKLRALEVLSIGMNKIKKLENLENLVNLKKLCGRFGIVEDISNIYSLSKLEVLNFQKNAIKDIKGIANLKGLKTLDLSQNKLAFGTKDLSNLANLRKLDLANNDLPGDISYLKLLSNIEYLDLSGNKIENFSMFQEINAPLKELRLEATDMTYNDLKYIIYNQILQNNLTNLSLANNKFPEILNIAPLESFKNLKHLVMDNNGFRAIEGSQALMKAANCNCRLQLHGNKLPLSEIHKISTGGILIEKQKNVLFDLIRIKVREPLVIPTTEMEIDGYKTVISVYSLKPVIINKGDYNEREGFETIFHKKNKEYKINNNEIVFLKPGEYYIRMYSPSIQTAPPNAKESAQYLYVETGLIKVTKN